MSNSSHELNEIASASTSAGAGDGAGDSAAGDGAGAAGGTGGVSCGMYVVVVGPSIVVKYVITCLSTIQIVFKKHYTTI